MNLSQITGSRTGSHSAANVAVRMLFILSVMLFLKPGVGSAATITAADCSYAAVQSAVSSANFGDTVVVPPGNVVWTSTLSINKDIQLIGAGQGQTIITNNVSRSVNNGVILSWSTMSNGFCRLSGFTFTGGAVDATVDHGSQNFLITGTCHAFRIDHCEFTGLNQNSVFEFFGWVYGVVDHCNFILKQAGAFMVNHDGFGGYQYGDGSWAAPDDWGTTNALYIENCSFSDFSNPGIGVLDSVNGARVVVRYNNITNCPIGSHGTESTGRARSVRWYEIYNNNMQFQTNYGEFTLAIYLRGGTATVFSNIVNGGFSHMLSLATYRECPNHFAAWDNISGANVWDSNNPTVFASGTATGPNSSPTLQDITKNWTSSWSGYFLRDVTKGLGIPIGGNTNNTITYSGYNPYGASFTINNGDSYEIRKVYAAIDQCGYGQGDLLTGTTPINTVTGTQTWPHEVRDLVYEWGNKFSFTIPGYSSGKVSSQNLTTAGTWVSDVARPGYTPLAYPHPLTVAASLLTPPTNLGVHP